MGDSASAPIPVVLCGKAEVVGRQVVEGLKPDIDVILFCQGSKPTAAEVPYILQGRAPPTQSSYIGSGTYATLPKAVIMGMAWNADDVALVKAAIESVGLPAGSAPVILRNDTSVPTPQPPDPEYGVQLMRRIRLAVGKLVRGEKLHGPEEGVVWY
ncbi:uncharacterized protein F4807DRAFT_234489 [Annulohypoxylon truncatum]|uniref:uncharacterized protein n=1 Tax=Annulohypoxylon truncatum TaxID=327061 RepID=UPI0020075117|nr:uncharacterized protein F4807DRAFT_234489 [Annulohypoxylon truncatum]KAI1206270.1 hypothetical protein F4807DRAFT_234489 [Annulohypoxylon truncatum]